MAILLGKPLAESLDSQPYNIPLYPHHQLKSSFFEPLASQSNFFFKLDIISLMEDECGYFRMLLHYNKAITSIAQQHCVELKAKINK